jgi:hypothetical protein
MSLFQCGPTDDDDDGLYYFISFRGPVAETDKEANQTRSLNYYTAFQQVIKEMERKLAELGGSFISHAYDGDRGSPMISYTIVAKVDKEPSPQQRDAITSHLLLFYINLLGITPK